MADARDARNEAQRRGMPRPPKEQIADFTGWLSTSLDKLAAADVTEIVCTNSVPVPADHPKLHPDRNTDNRGKAGYWAARDAERRVGRERVNEALEVVVLEVEVVRFVVHSVI